MTDAGQDKRDLTNGVSESELTDGATLVGQVGDDAVLLARRGREIFAIGATCTHYGGPLGEGLFVEDTVRCPWHHACFSLRTGEALAAPALNATSCWRIERRDGASLLLFSNFAKVRDLPFIIRDRLLDHLHSWSVVRINSGK